MLTIQFKKYMYEICYKKKPPVGKSRFVILHYNPLKQYEM